MRDDGHKRVREHNDYLDYIKCIACFGVVVFHLKFPDVLVDGVLQSPFRFAMPFFFMISGYYSYYADNADVRKNLPRKMRHILKIGVVGLVFYFLFNVGVYLFGDNHGSYEWLLSWLRDVFSFGKWLDFVIFNVDPFINILWYIFSLLYCYGLLYVINRYNLYSMAYRLIPILLSVHLCLGNILFLFGVDVKVIYYRNFLLFGLPFVLTGNLIHRFQDTIVGKLKENRCRALVCTGTALSVAEWFIFGRQELYVGSMMIALGAFIMAITCPSRHRGGITAYIGGKYSLFIYITHLCLGSVLDKIFSRISFINPQIYAVYRWLRIPLVFAVAVAAAFVFYRVLSFCAYKRRKETPGEG